MTTPLNRAFRLVNRPVGALKESDLRFEEETLRALEDNEVLVRTVFLSLDPANRIWMNEAASYMPPVGLGDVMRGVGVGIVEASRHLDYAEGAAVLGLLGWQSYGIHKGKHLTLLPPSPLPLSAYLSVLGLTGQTAYFGMLDIGAPKAGETVVVSAAAGAVGSVAGQLAKERGARVIGIAGSDKKCRWLTGDLGFDASINYRERDIREAFKEACPDGLDVYFENVGGVMLEAAIERAKDFARIPLCGLISSYNATTITPALNSRHLATILMRRIRLQGFIVTDYMPRYPEATRYLAERVMTGKIKYLEDIVVGLENAPQALTRLFDGSNNGKLIVQVSDASQTN